MLAGTNGQFRRGALSQAGVSAGACAHPRDAASGRYEPSRSLVKSLGAGVWVELELLRTEGSAVFRGESAATARVRGGIRGVSLFVIYCPAAQET